jgi:hypothetical protein
MRFTEFISENEKPGLWANIHAKRDRIKHGSGERMRKPGSKGAPTADALRKSATDEAANPAQQAAIAINMKKHHQKPKGVAEGYLNEERDARIKRIKELSEGLSTDDLAKVPMFVVNSLKKAAFATGREAVETKDAIQIAFNWGQATPEQKQAAKKQLIDVAKIAAGLALAAGVGHVGAATLGVGHAATTLGAIAKTTIEHLISDIGIEAVAEVLATAGGITIVKNALHDITTSSGHEFEKSLAQQQAQPAQAGTFAAGAPKVRSAVQPTNVQQVQRITPMPATRPAVKPTNTPQVKRLTPTMAESVPKIDVKKQISKFEELALAANRAGDDAKCKQYQQKIQSLKQKMSQGVAEGSEDLVQIEYWQQETMESGRWVKTKPIPRATAEKIVNSFERGEIVDVEQGVAEGTANDVTKLFTNVYDPVYANLQRVALLAMQGRQSEAAGLLQRVIKDADPAVQKKITDAVNSIKPVTINGRVADSSTLDKSKSHQDWIINTFIPWVQSLLGQQGVAEGERTIFSPGTQVTVPHKGKMVSGKIVRYDSGKGIDSPAYIVDISEYESLIVPVSRVKQDMDEGENWSKYNHKRVGGMSKKSVSSYRRSHPGSKIQTAVTTKPSKLKKGSKAAKRRASFCARMRGMKKHRTGAKTARDPNSNINKSLRRWHCESIEELHQLVMLAEQFIRNNKK